MATSADVSVIICAYTHERWVDLVGAIDSVVDQTCRPREVILVIDHNPSLLDRARQHLAPEVTVVESTRVPGLSGARNSGIASARGQLVAFLDDDARAAPGWLEYLLRAFDGQDVLGVGGAIQPAWTARRPGWFPGEFDWVVGCTYTGMPTTSGQVRNLIGASMCLRRDVLEQLHGFGDGLGRIGTQPFGCEETDLCIRAHRRWPDGRFVYEPRAIVRHRVSSARATWTYFRRRCYAEGLSKAALAGRVGADAALGVERGYVLGTLPAGLWRAVGRVLERRELMGLAEAGAIVLGLAATAAGYGQGLLFCRRPTIGSQA